MSKWICPKSSRASGQREKKLVSAPFYFPNILCVIKNETEQEKRQKVEHGTDTKCASVKHRLQRLSTTSGVVFLVKRHLYPILIVYTI
jgi:hypothetical protein